MGVGTGQDIRGGGGLEGMNLRSVAWRGRQIMILRSMGVGYGIKAVHMEG